ncbi:MAG: hypothetical protein JXR37_29805 [Kiritimatiellae bacterium]|nr:hypothetical protein [Kiritimatiellia bacterium]
MKTLRVVLACLIVCSVQPLHAQTGIADRHDELCMGVSPNGVYLAAKREANGARTLVIKDLTTKRETAVPDTANLAELIWSPNSDCWVGVFRTDNTESLRLCTLEGKASPLGAGAQPSFHPRGTHLACIRNEGLVVHDLRSGKQTLLARQKSGAAELASPVWIGDDQILFIRLHEIRRIDSVSRNSEPRIVMDESPSGKGSPTRLIPSPDRTRLVVCRDGAILPGLRGDFIFVTPVEPMKLRRIGEGRGITWLDDRHLILENHERIYRLGLDKEAIEKTVISGKGQALRPSVSRAGTVFYDIRTEDTNDDLFVNENDRSAIVSWTDRAD